MRISAHELTTDHKLLFREDPESESRLVVIEGFEDEAIDANYFFVVGYYDDNGDDFYEVFDTSDTVVVE